MNRFRRDVIERRACETFKNYRSTFDDVTDDVTDDVMLRNVDGLLGDVIPLNLKDRSSVPSFAALHLSEGGSEGGLEGGKEPERSRVTASIKYCHIEPKRYALVT